MRANRRFPTWLRWTIVVVVVLGGMVIAWHRIDARARRDLEAARAAFAEHGFPTRIEEILPPVAEEENVDVLLREAWAIATGSTDWDTSMHAKFDEMVSVDYQSEYSETEPIHLLPAGLAELQRLALDPEITCFAEALQRAAVKPAWRQEIDTDSGMELLLPTISPVRKMIQILCRRALGLAQDPATVTLAWQDLHTAQILANRVVDTPFLIHHLTSIACHGIIRATIVDILQSTNSWPEPVPFLAEASRTLPDAPSALEMSLHAERLLAGPWYEAHLAREGDWLAAVAENGRGPAWLRWSHPWLTPVLSPVARPRLWMELTMCQEFHLEAALAMQTGGPAMMDRLCAVRTEAETTSLIASETLIVSFDKIARTHLVGLTDRRALVVALAAMHYRRLEQRWPESLASLTLPEDLTIDAFTSAPLILLTDDVSVTVYGFGYDGDDDHGTAIDFRKGDYDGDIVVRLQVPGVESRVE